VLSARERDTRRRGEGGNVLRECDVRASDKHLLLAGALALVSAATIPPAEAQLDPVAVRHRNECRLAKQVLTHGKTANRYDWAPRMSTHCGEVGGAGLAALIRRQSGLLFEWAARLPQVDASRVAFVGFSWGGLASVAAAGRNPRVRAVVSLDGSIRYYSRRFERFPHLHPDRLTVPALFLHGFAPPPEAIAAGSGREEEVGEDPSFVYFERLRHSDAMVVTFPALRHQNFNVIFPALIGTSRPSLFADPAVASAGVERIARYTGAFLDAVLKDDAAGRAFLDAPPEAHGIPPGEAVVERKAAAPREPGA
jgi:pimeloyl-ACP methyl ester carboxylesterase